MSKHVNPSKIMRILCISIFLFGFSFISYSQSLLKEIPSFGIFSPEIEQVEDPKNGIVIYDQYCTLNKEAKTRKASSGGLLDGKHQDLYAQGLLLHKGTYENGKLGSFTNYYQNGSIERTFKSKGDGTGDLACFYLNGYNRTIKKFQEYKLYHLEEYYDNGVLAHMEKKDKKSFYPMLIIDKSYGDRIINQIEINDKKSLKYIQIILAPNGKKVEEGELLYLPKTDEFIHEGLWITFDRSERRNSEVIYEGGNMKEVKYDKRKEEDRVYFTYEPEENEQIVEEKIVNDTGNSGSSEPSVIPTLYSRFDGNKDEFISNKEVDIAVSEFFEDDSITLEQINGLVNYFFEQE